MSGVSRRFLFRGRIFLHPSTASVGERSVFGRICERPPLFHCGFRGLRSARALDVPFGCFRAGVIGIGQFSAFRSLSTEHLRPSNVSVRESFRFGPYLRARAFVPSCMGVGAAVDVPFKNDVFPKIELCRRGFPAFSACELRGARM